MSSSPFGPYFAPAQEVAARNAAMVTAATSAEIRAGYPMSSYVSFGHPAAAGVLSCLNQGEAQCNQLYKDPAQRARCIGSVHDQCK